MSSSSFAVASARSSTPPPSPSSPNHIQIRSPIPKRPSSASPELTFLVQFHDDDDEDVVIVDRVNPAALPQEQAPLLAKTVDKVAKSIILGVDLPEERTSLLEKGITPIPLPTDPRLVLFRNTSPVPEDTDSFAPVKLALGAVVLLVTVVACVVLAGKRGA